MNVGDKVFIIGEITATGEMITVRIASPSRPSAGVNVRVLPDVLREPRKAGK